MKFSIPYQDLQLISYEGAGNRTPVLDLRNIPMLPLFHPEDAREWLETDAEFRLFLREQGQTHNADTIMLYYPVTKRAYDFITFIAEPNAPLTAPFSDMCGNGIRCLAYHIVSTEADSEMKKLFLDKGLSIWAGIPRVITIDSLEQNSAMVRVSLGEFHTAIPALSRYCTLSQHTNLHDFVHFRIPSISYPFLKNHYFGLGFNGDEQSGEPHLVLLVTEHECSDLYKHLFGEEINLSEKDRMLPALRRIVCEIGPSFTFNKELFPRGVNLNLGLFNEDAIYMTTHERYLSESEKECHAQRQKTSFCRCNTLACGTGGAAVSNIAYLQDKISTPLITTVHPGGEVRYEIQEKNTIMIGPARRIGERLL